MSSKRIRLSKSLLLREETEMTIKINRLELENVKRIKAVKVEPNQNGLTVIGGRNNQGKTSVLDSIAWALGGNKFKPSNAAREGSTVPPNLNITLSNGLVVERKGKNSALKITDPNGNKAGQQILNGFIEELALDLPKFMEASNKEKANILLRIIGVGEQLAKLNYEESEIYNNRLAIGRIADQKKKYAKEQVFYSEAPKDLISPQELINQQQAILAKNGENQRKRDKVTQIEYSVSILTEEVAALQKQLLAKQTELNKATNDLTIAKTDALALIDQSTEELEKNLAEIEEINRKVRANLDKDKAEEDANNYASQYNEMTVKIEEIRKQRIDLLKGADLPLPGLSVEDNELTYNGKKWDGMSGSDQLRVATAIVRKLNPDCGFVLIDKLEQMDIETMNEFGAWLEQEGLQAIATRVSTGDECSIVIEDGYVKGQMLEENPSVLSSVNGGIKEQAETPKWKEGEF
jgi:predicted ATP-dependent endonuclease of OLD family